MTTRQRFAAKVDGNGLCQTCHASFSNLGYVMEAYDALGRFRTMEKVFDEQTGALLATLPIDTSGGPAGDRSATCAPVSGPAELNQRIIESGKVEACLSANYFRYALRRDPTARQRRRLRVRGDAQRPRRRAARWPPRSAASRASASFRQHKVGAP